MQGHANTTCTVPQLCVSETPDKTMHSALLQQHPALTHAKFDHTNSTPLLLPSCKEGDPPCEGGVAALRRRQAEAVSVFCRLQVGGDGADLANQAVAEAVRCGLGLCQACFGEPAVLAHMRLHIPIVMHHRGLHAEGLPPANGSLTFSTHVMTHCSVPGHK